MSRTRKPETMRSRRLRRDMTIPERRLWWYLDQVPPERGHFRRQAPIGPFVVDFAHLSSRLVIEVDGDHHGREPHAAKDATRTAWLEAQGFRVLRFSNADVMRHIESVLDTIYAALHGQNGRDVLPSPLWGGVGGGGVGAVLSGAGADTPTRPFGPTSPQGGGEKGASPTDATPD